MKRDAAGLADGFGALRNRRAADGGFGSKTATNFRDRHGGTHSDSGHGRCLPLARGWRARWGIVARPK
jgi:hypothetical protein